MGVIIHCIYSPVLLRPQVVNDQSVNCYINLSMRTKMEWKVADPRMHIPQHFIWQPNEHGIRGFNIPTLWQRDGKVTAFGFYISTEIGIFHMYFAEERIKCMHNFGLDKNSRYDQVFVSAIGKSAEKLRPFFGYDIHYTNVGSQHIVLVKHSWCNPVTSSGVRSFTSYHSYKCKLLMPITAKLPTKLAGNASTMLGNNL